MSSSSRKFYHLKNNMYTEWGAIGVGATEADRVLGWVVNRDDILDPVNTFEDNQYEYNQDEFISLWRRNLCTMYQAFGAWSDLTGEYIDTDTRRELVAKSIEQWLDVSIGWYVHRAVKLVADYFDDISYARVIMDSDDYHTALDKWFSLMEWYRGNSAYRIDRNDNRIVETNDWGIWSYWHARRAWGIDQRTDNYEGRDSNIYRLPELGKKIEGGNIFKYAYFYFDKITLPWPDKLPPHISTKDMPTQLWKDTVKAWETEMVIHLLRGGKLIYSNYYSLDARDYDQILVRMLNDLQQFRR